MIQIPNLDMNNGYINVDQNNESSIKGLFAIGDVVNKKLKQISNAVGEGAEAAISVNRFINKR